MFGIFKLNYSNAEAAINELGPFWADWGGEDAKNDAYIQEKEARDNEIADEQEAAKESKEAAP